MAPEMSSDEPKRAITSFGDCEKYDRTVFDTLDERSHRSSETTSGRSHCRFVRRPLGMTR